jgi:hypothetical protein
MHDATTSRHPLRITYAITTCTAETIGVISEAFKRRGERFETLHTQPVTDGKPKRCLSLTRCGC